LYILKARLQHAHFQSLGVKMLDEIDIIDELAKLKANKTVQEISPQERSSNQASSKVGSSVSQDQDEETFTKTFGQLAINKKTKQHFDEKEESEGESDNENDNVRQINNEEKSVIESENDQESQSEDEDEERYYNVDEIEENSIPLNNNEYDSTYTDERQLLDIQMTNRYYKTGPKKSYKLFYHNDSYHVDTSLTKNIGIN
jgi:hypothetical protein